MSEFVTVEEVTCLRCGDVSFGMDEYRKHFCVGSVAGRLALRDAQRMIDECFLYHDEDIPPSDVIAKVEEHFK